MSNPTITIQIFKLILKTVVGFGPDFRVNQSADFFSTEFRIRLWNSDNCLKSDFLITHPRTDLRRVLEINPTVCG